jgi:hypothetical protein
MIGFLWAPITGLSLHAHVRRVATVDTMYGNLDVIWALAALVPLGIAAAAWALQMSCGFCSVDPPEFWHAVMTVVIIAFTNVILRFVLQITDQAAGMGPQYLMPGVATAAVIAIMLPTGPFTASTITVVQVVLCALMYYAVCWLCALVTVPFMI